jgi:hypothetical protein
MNNNLNENQTSSFNNESYNNIKNQSINFNNQNMMDPRAQFPQSGMLYQTKFQQFPNNNNQN